MRRRHDGSPYESARTLFALFLALTAIAAATAQEAGVGAVTPPAPMAPGGFTIDTTSYALAPGDVLAITVMGEEELSGSYGISPAGTISMVMVGRIEARGLTTDQLAEEITDRLRAVMKRPVVQVGIDAEASVREVLVAGSVTTPGTHPIRFGGTIAEAVLAAGPTPQADLSAVRVARAGQPTLTVDLGGLRGGDQLGNIPDAQSGDLVHVPKLADADFAVYGMVALPGLKPLDPENRDDLDVVKALNAAGGQLEGADLSEAMILRADGQTETVNLKALLFEGDASQNKRMGPGDALIVRAADKITVAGEVTEPTSFLAPEPVGILEAVAQAKGFTPNADLKGATVLRAGGPETVNLEDLWWRGDLTKNVTVNPGESVLIPERDPLEVLVVGAVTTPGSVDIHRAANRSVVRYVQAAAPKPEADLRRVTIHRTGASAPIVVDVKAIMEEGNRQADVEVQPGDTVFVPEAEKVYAAGAFIEGGAFPLTDNMTVLELVAMAKGFSTQAEPAKARLVRAQPGAGEQAIPVNFRRIERGAEAGDLRLVAGDILFVPARGQKERLSFTDILWSVAGVLSIFR